MRDMGPILAKIAVLEKDKELLQETVAEQSKEIERLWNALIIERNDALTWDGIGTVDRINKVLSTTGKKGAET